MPPAEKVNLFQKYRRTLVMTTVFVVLVLVAILIIQYMNIQGFKKTLAALVDTGTKGAYSLTIEETDINHFTTSFALRQLKIVKNDTINSGGVQQVIIPELSVDVGTLLDMITSRQFKINEFVIAEPLVEMELTTNNGRPKHDDGHINMARHVAQFWPAVRATLDNFDIKNFRIERGGLDLESPDDPDLKIRFLDLLVSNWNMRNLTEDADVRLSIGDQTIHRSGSDFQFGAVVYDYRANELYILDYVFHQTDSLENTQIELEGDSLKIINLDYEQLVEKQAYVVDQLLVIGPRFTANLYPGKGKGGRTTTSWHPLSDILKKNLGNLRIREGNIVKAQVQLNVLAKDDTMRLNLPSMNLHALGFEVSEDSATLMIEDLTLDIHKTEIDLNESLSIGFANLSYDEGYNVRIDSMKAVDKVTGKDLFFSERLDLYNFSIFNYFYENDLRLDSMVVENGRIDLYRNPTGFGQGIGGAGSADQEKLRPEVHIGDLKFSNFQANISLGNRKVLSQDISGELDNVIKEDRLNYSLKFLQSPHIYYSDSGEEIELQITNTRVSPSQIRVGAIDAMVKDLELDMRGFTAVPLSGLLSVQSADRWQRVEIAELTLQGQVPVLKKDTTVQKGPSRDIQVGSFRLGRLVTDLNFSDTATISQNINNVHLVNGIVQNGTFNYDRVEANIAEALFKTDTRSVELGPSRIRSDSLSSLQSLVITQDNKFEATISEIVLGPWLLESGDYEMEHLSLRNMQYTDLSHQLVSRMDSIKLVELQYSKGTTPYVQDILVYGPDINLAATDKNEGQDKTESKSPARSLNMFDTFTMYPGQVTLGDQTISFNKVEFSLQEKQPVFDLEQIALKTPGNSIHVGRIRSSGASLLIDSVYLVPVPEYLETITVETDVLAARLDHLQVQNIRWDSLIDKQKMHCDEVMLDGFELSIKRDKTLPDPEPKDKPYLLGELIPIPDQVWLPKISGQNGRLVYFEIGEKTGQEGHIAVDDIEFVMDRYNEESRGSALIYDQGPITYHYKRLDSGKFSLNVRLTDLPMPLLNQMVDPLQAAKIKSGQLHEYELNMIGDSVQARGQGTITYDDLHVEIFKSHQPDVRNLGSELLTLLVDRIILKHSKSGASADFVQDRITYKGPINFWVKSGIHGASAAVIKGKPPKRKKGSEDDTVSDNRARTAND